MTALELKALCDKIIEDGHGNKQIHRADYEWGNVPMSVDYVVDVYAGSPFGKRFKKPKKIVVIS